MTAFSHPLFLAGLVCLALAALATVVLLVLPSRAVPLKRRRPGVPRGRRLQSLSSGLTGLVGRAMGTREARLSELLADAGIKQEARDVLVLVVTAGFTLGALGLVLGGPLGGLLGLILVALGSLGSLVVLAGRRRKAFADQLDETLQILAGSLRAGYSLPQAAATVAAESEAPTSEEFSRIINEARVGRPLVEALEQSARRVGSEDFFWVIQAIAINREVGGNLAEVLNGVSDTLRERAQLRRQVNALSAEGKLSGWVLGFLPVGVGGILAIGNPKYMGRLVDNPIGIMLLVLSAILLVAGAFWMRAAVRIKY